MSRLITSPQELNQVVSSRPRAMVLFYASWCPFCQEFLPYFEKAAVGHGQDMLRFLVDDAEEAIGAFRIDIYPAVLFFESGALTKRLDGRAGIGLSERQLQAFVASCKA
ncbi:MAG TPA: thioredoxin family protein [Planctomycetota bacterium]|nr:thioredoxin family protein [Planctomycetota bacterium]